MAHSSLIISSLQRVSGGFYSVQYSVLLSALFVFIAVLLTPLPLSPLWACNAQQLEKSRSVWVEQGLVRGKIYTIWEQQLQIFRGIPYAEPPVGELRFKRPVKKAKWEREYAATEYGAPCIQFMDFHKNDRYAAVNMRNENEDCLFLNIFSPYNPEDEGRLYPILVWIHGGSFLAGSSDTGIDMETVARNLVFRNLTFITINYRLGPLGFMSINYDEGSPSAGGGNSEMGGGSSSERSSGSGSSGTGAAGGHIEGNFGIWDQKLALEWIHRNIKQFNGDPSRVTVMGESAGAAAASVLGLSPLTKGLVHQVVAMSGSVTAGWAIHRRHGHGTPQWDMSNLAEYIRCNKVISEEDLQEILSHEPPSERDRKREHCNLQDSVPNCLANGGHMTTEELLDCFRNEVNFSSPLFRRALSAELGVSKIVVDGELLIDSGVDMVGRHAHVPFLTGVARREWGHKKPEYYQFFRYENISRRQVEESVRKVSTLSTKCKKQSGMASISDEFKIIDTAYVARLPSRVPNSTIDLISNATFLRYMLDIDFHYDMPGVVTRLQDLEADIEFVSPCQLEVDGYVKNGVPVYLYSFDYVPRGSLVEEDERYYRMFGDNSVAISRRDQTSHGFKLAAFHGLDHAFIFTEGYSSNFHIEPYTKRDKTMSGMLTKMLANFVTRGDPSTENFTWPAFTNESAHYVSLNLPPRLIRGSIHFPAPAFWNEEVAMLSRYIYMESQLYLDRATMGELSTEERIQLYAYRKAWYVLWLLVGAIAVLIWVAAICCVVYKVRSPTSKPYDNIVLNSSNNGERANYRNY